jgi:hypothetical protein
MASLSLRYGEISTGSLVLAAEANKNFRWYCLQDVEGMETALRTLEGVPLKGLDLRLEKVDFLLTWFDILLAWNALLTVHLENRGHPLLHHTGPVWWRGSRRFSW